jgi:MFS family permease
MLLGVAEAGLFPGVMYYLTKWFTVKDRAKANGAFLLGVSIANIVGAPIGGVLLTMDGLLGLHGWQWMFLIEGLPACFLAILVWKFLPDGPRQASFLSAAEAERLEATIAAEEQAGATGASNHRLIDIVRDPQILLVVGVYFGHQLAVYALNFFLPSIIGGWGDIGSIQIGLLTAVPWLFSAVGALLLPRFATTASTSKMIALGAMIGIIVGFIIGALGGPVVGLIGFCLAAFNFFALQPILFTYPATRLTGVGLAAGLALVNTVGLLGGFLGPYIMGFMEDLTGSGVSGLWLIVGVCVIGAFLIPFLKQGQEAVEDSAQDFSSARSASTSKNEMKGKA